MFLLSYSEKNRFNVTLTLIHLEESHFTDDGVVDVHSDVQPHLIWQLDQKLLLIYMKREAQTLTTIGINNPDILSMTLK